MVTGCCARTEKSMYMYAHLYINTGVNLNWLKSLCFLCFFYYFFISSKCYLNICSLPYFKSRVNPVLTKLVFKLKKIFDGAYGMNSVLVIKF